MTLKKSLLLLTLLCLTHFSCQKVTNDIVIGEFGSLTGGTATFGQSTHKGIMLATEEVNAAGGLLGKKVRIITEDDQSRPEEAKTAVLKLIKQDKVIALLGEVASSRTLAAAPEAQKAKIPLLSPASTNPKVTEIGDYIFRACFIDSFQGEGMARFAYDVLGLRRVAILKDTKNDYSVGLADFFDKTFKSIGGTVVDIKSYSEGDIEFRAQLTSLKNQNPDGLFIPGYYTEVGLIGRQAREMGLTVPLFGGDGWDSHKTIDIGGAAMENTYFSTHYAEDNPAPEIQNFIQKYKAKYNATPDAMSVLGYDAAQMMFEAIRQAGSTDAKAIRDKLAQLKNFQGVSGQISMDENRNAQKALSILKIQNGKFVFHKMVPPVQ